MSRDDVNIDEKRQETQSHDEINRLTIADSSGQGEKRHHPAPEEIGQGIDRAAPRSFLNDRLDDRLDVRIVDLFRRLSGGHGMCEAVVLLKSSDRRCLPP